jgi:hypothetical protein
MRAQREHQGAQELLAWATRDGEPEPASIGAKFVADLRQKISNAEAAMKEVYHYASSDDAADIEREGLKRNPYATGSATLRPMQSQIDLALAPNWDLRDAVFVIDLAAMRRDGLEIPLMMRTTRYNAMPGGEYEMKFPYDIPSKYLRRIR